MTAKLQLRHIGLAALLIAGGLAATRSPLLSPLLSGTKSASADAASMPPVSVSAARAVMEDFPIILTGLGTVQALQTITVRSRVDGEIKKIDFQEGQLVKEGDLLAEIDERPYVAALAQAEAKHLQDLATLASAKVDLERYNMLVKTNAVSRQVLDQQASTVSQLDFLTKADAALVDAARTQLDYTRITSPIAGRTGFRQIDQGNIISGASLTGIVVVTQVSPIGVVFTAPGQNFARIRKALDAGNADVVALTTDGNKELARGRLALMDNLIDTASGALKLKAIFDNRNNELWPGLAVSTRLRISTRTNVVVVPDSALQRGRDGLFAFVVDDNNTVSRRNVEAAVIADGKALVSKGIVAGETVVTNGQYRLAQHTRVTIKEAAETEAAASGISP